MQFLIPLAFLLTFFNAGSVTAKVTDAPTRGTRAVLAAHNAARAKHGAAPLKWDDKLASYARQHASKCVWEHSQGPYGENLAMGTTLSYTNAVAMWMNEAKDYNAGDGFSMATGHFTQVVWKSTQRLGCARVTSCSSGQLGLGRRALGNGTAVAEDEGGVVAADDVDDDEDEDEENLEVRATRTDRKHRKHRKHRSTTKKNKKKKKTSTSTRKRKGKGSKTTTAKKHKTTQHTKKQLPTAVPGGSRGGPAYIVCEYYPPGNYQGQFAQNVEV